MELLNLFASPSPQFMSEYLLFIIYLKADFFTLMCTHVQTLTLTHTHTLTLFRPLAIFCKLHYIDSTYVSCVSCAVSVLYFRLFYGYTQKCATHSVCACGYGYI